MIEFPATVMGRLGISSTALAILAVVRVRGNTSLEGRIRYDLEYIERWSLGLDLRIILLTAGQVLLGRNAY